MCPICACAKVIQWILSYPGINKDTQVNTFFDGVTIIHIQNKSILYLLHASAIVLGKDFLGFAPNELGVQSIRSGAAMAMYLEGVPFFTIMLLGHCSSDVFLRYIHRQVQEFSSGVLIEMITHHSFCTIPDTPSGIEDPRVSGNACNLSARSQNAPHASLSTMPRFALHT
jgi:hypothetical protein